MVKAITKQAMRRNPLAEWLTSAVRLLQGRRTTILAVAAAVVVIGGAGGAYWWYQERQEAEAARALAAAYGRARGEPGEQPGIPGDALEQFRSIAERHRGTRAAEEGLIVMGNLQYEAGKVDEAASSYTEYLAAYPRGRFRLMAALGKAYALEAKGDLQGAAQILSHIIERERDNPLAGEAYVTLGRMYEGLKKPEDAMRIYGLVVETFTQTNWAQLALQRMTALKGN
jgi:TolA-binding protein